MLSLRRYVARLRGALDSTYHSAHLYLSSLPWKIRRRYMGIKTLARACRVSLQRARKKKARTIGFWNSKRKKAFNAVVKRNKQSGLRSPVPHLLNSNDPPNEEETFLVRKALEGAEEQFKLNTDEMRIKAHWDPAGASKLTPPPQMIRLEVQISQLKSVSSALRHFPPELLQTIFSFGLFPRPPNPEHYYPQDAFAWPWTVSQVCHRWRNAAISMPVLWSYLPPLYIRRIQMSGELHLRHAMFEVMIERSKDMALHVVVHGYITGRIPPHSPTFDLLVKHSERWETAVMHLSPSQLRVFSKIKGRLSRLRRLTIVMWYSSPTDGIPRDIFAVAPELVDITCYYNDLALEFPRGQITDCSIRSSNSDTQVRQTISSNAAILKTLSLGSCPLFPLPGFITLPNLTKFSLSSSSYLDTGGIDNLVLPALVEFYFAGNHTTVLTDALALLQRSSQATVNIFPLKKLGIGHSVAPVIASDPETFISILRLTSCLQSLECPVPPLSVLLRLAKTESEDVVIPWMEYCKFDASANISACVARALNNIGLARCEFPVEECEDPLDSPSTKRLRSFVIGTCYGEPVYGDKLAHYQRTLEGSWTHQLIAVPKTGDPEYDLANSDEEDSSDEPQPPNVAMMNTLQELLEVVLRGKRKYFGDPVTSNPFSKNHISSQQANALISHLKLCRKEQNDVKFIAASRIEGYEYESLQRCLKDTSARTKKAYPYLRELEVVLKDLLDAWLFAIDEKLPSLHWVFSRYSQALLYIPLSDPIRSTDNSTALALDLDHQLDDYLEEHRKISEECSVTFDGIY